MNVADIQADEPVAGAFLVAATDVRTTRNGDPYLRLTLRDAQGESIDALYFRVTDEVVATVEAGVTYEVRGKGDAFRGRLNVKVDGLERACEQWDTTALLPRSEREADDLVAAIQQAAATIIDVDVRSVVDAVLAADVVAERLATWPAAKTRHHAWLGGLAEHTVEMLGLADRVAETYPTLDRDLLVAGVILHDLGKLLELEIGADFAYSVAGNLESHMAQGVRLLDAAVAQTGCPDEMAMLLRHLVLSHQGTREFGALVEPMTPEAIALHYIDQLSSQIRPAIEDVKAARSRGAVFRGRTSMRPLFARSETTDETE